MYNKIQLSWKPLTISEVFYGNHLAVSTPPFCQLLVLTTSDFSEKMQSSVLSGANHFTGSLITSSLCCQKYSNALSETKVNNFYHEVHINPDTLIIVFKAIYSGQECIYRQLWLTCSFLLLNLCAQCPSLQDISFPLLLGYTYPSDVEECQMPMRE